MKKPIIALLLSWTLVLLLAGCQKEDLSEDFETQYTPNSNLKTDLNGDGRMESIQLDLLLPPTESHLRDTDRDGKPDLLVLGLAGQARPGPNNWNLDNDRGANGQPEFELLVLIPLLPLELPPYLDLDGDTDPDIVLVADNQGQELPDRIDIDNDKEEEIIEEDPKLEAGKSKGESLDKDKDPDKITVGLKGGATRKPDEDIDGGGEKEIIIEDPNVEPGKTKGIDLDGDKDPDIVVIGTKGKGKRSASTDLNGDGKPELVLEDPNIDGAQGIDLNGDGKPDGVVVGTKGPKDGAPGVRQPDIDIDGDKEPEILIKGAGKEGKADIDGDGDIDVIFTK